MAVLAGHDRVDEVLAALRRRLRASQTGRRDQRCSHGNKANEHAKFPPIPFRPALFSVGLSRATENTNANKKGRLERRPFSQGRMKT
jgi:hypothetical protein